MCSFEVFPLLYRIFSSWSFVFFWVIFWSLCALFFSLKSCWISVCCSYVIVNGFLNFLCMFVVLVMSCCIYNIHMFFWLRDCIKSSDSFLAKRWVIFHWDLLCSTRYSSCQICVWWGLFCMNISRRYWLLLCISCCRWWWLVWRGFVLVTLLLVLIFLFFFMSFRKFEFHRLIVIHLM